MTKKLTDVKRAINASLKEPKLTKFAEGRSTKYMVLQKNQRVYLYMDNNNNIFVSDE